MIESISPGGACRKLPVERSFCDAAGTVSDFLEPGEREGSHRRLEFNPPAFKARLYFVLSFRGRRNLPNRYESLGTIWNPEGSRGRKSSFRPLLVMDKSSRGQKLNVELVSNYGRRRIVSLSRLSRNRASPPPNGYAFSSPLDEWLAFVS